MKVGNLVLKSEHGFTESFVEKMTIGVNMRLNLKKESGNIDIYEWAKKECEKRCGIEGSKNFTSTCMDCDCEIDSIYWAIVKLGMIEEAFEKVEVVAKIETKTNFKNIDFFVDGKV